MDKIFNKVLNTVNKYNMISPGDKVLAGFSGGADSLFLMIMLKKLQNHIDFKLYAAHLNHGIRGLEADRDMNFVKKYCTENNIEFFSKNVSITDISKKFKISEETAGRQERYSFFNELCNKFSINKIAVAHNMNDSVETVVHNLIRGSSLNGLTGIKPVNNNIIRPIIEINRESIEEYLEKCGASYCIDSTNSSDMYTRNKIRNNILKSFKEINESAIETIHNNLQILKDDDSFLSKYANDLNCIQSDNKNIIINKALFDKQMPAIKRRLIMTAFGLLKGDSRNISSKHVEIICNALTSGKQYNMPGEINIYVTHDDIIFSESQTDSNEYSFELSVGECKKCYDNTYISASYCSAFNPEDKDSLYIDADKLKCSKLKVRNRMDGDKFVPYGFTKAKRIKKILIDLKIPSFQKNNVPVICDGDEIVGIVPYRISDAYKTTEQTNKIIKINLTKETNYDLSIEKRKLFK